jgi:hypothetical protein
MKLLLVSIMAFGLAMTSFAQQAAVKHTPEGVQVTVNVTVQCPCQKQVGPQRPFTPPQGQMWQHRRGQAQKLESPKAEPRRQMGPPPGRGRGFGGPPTNRVEGPKQ